MDTGRLQNSSLFTSIKNATPAVIGEDSPCKPPTRLVNKRMIGYRDEKLSSDPKTEGEREPRSFLDAAAAEFLSHRRRERASGSAAVDKTLISRTGLSGG